ncbi:MAG: hypothetical protein DHS20C15_19040 [Planctomycetota bacterium]|nr:MAG: hypothetical protein DHS20C15_19040 [Planctomycetota bacterium]
MGIVEGILWVLFVLACLLISAVILLQEGKGGGLGDAFGGAGAQTFGVKAGGITKFTGYLAVGIVVLAVVITQIRSSSSSVADSLSDGTAGDAGLSVPAGAEVGVETEPAVPAGDDG